MSDDANDRPAIPLRPKKVVGDMGLGSREQMFKLRGKPAATPEVTTAGGPAKAD
jgi:hypothetical protein